MPGTKAGAIKYKENMIKKLGEKGFSNHQAEIGRKGGKAPHSSPKGFASMTSDRVKDLGAKGGNARWDNS